MDGMQEVADALSLLANIVVTWNTAQMQSILNFRGVFRFPIERYAEQLLPTSSSARMAAAGR